jgi:methylthioribose-1-phosphate isomerase
MADEKAPTSGVDNIPRTIWWGEDEASGRPAVFLIDQTRLPLQGDVLMCNVAEGVCLAIQSLGVRGAPALGVAAALALALWTANETEGIETTEDYVAGLTEVAQAVMSTRPTAVNLFWGAERIRRAAMDNIDLPLEDLKELIIQEARNMEAEDEKRNRMIGEHGAALLPDEAKVLTHCNAGSLATAYFGTALGIVFTAHEQGKIAHVWVDETRPVNQGGRLTTWELGLAGVPNALVADSMAGFLMSKGWVDAIIVGADRIAANGDTANKIGTYALAVLAKHHGIPFYVAAPTSTVDLTISSGDDIVIEERDPREMMGFTVSGTFEPDSSDASKAFDVLTKDGSYDMKLTKGHRMVLERKGGGYSFDGWFRITPPNVQVFNPAFDVTPGELITAIITERGPIRPEPDFETALALMCMMSGGMHELTIEGFAGAMDFPQGTFGEPIVVVSEDFGAEEPQDKPVPEDS